MWRTPGVVSAWLEEKEVDEAEEEEEAEVPRREGVEKGAMPPPTGATTPAGQGGSRPGLQSTSSGIGAAVGRRPPSFKSRNLNPGIF